MRRLVVALLLCSAATIAVADSQVASLEPDDTPVATKKPLVIHVRPRRLAGTLTVGESQFDYASGGRGWSVPYGSYPITPDDVGSWGKRHGAIGLNRGDDIPDPQLGRNREGIEIHGSDHMASAGCVVVDTDVFKKLKHLIFDLIEKAGQAFLHIGPTGAAITATKDSPLPAYVYLPEKVSEDDGADRHHSRRKYAHHHHQHRVHYVHRHHSRES